MSITKENAIGLLILSAVLFTVGWIILFWRRGRNNTRVSFAKRGVGFAIFLLFATTIARYVVGRTGILEQGLLYAPEEAVNSFLHALQSFSMDEDYTEYLVKGGEALGELTDNASFASAYKVYASILSLSCAITSQVTLAAVIIKVFPRVKLLLVPLCFWKHLYYFSELNIESVSLAKSIKESNENQNNALLVFCNADVDNDEISSECIEQARQLGALLTKISLADLKLHRRKGKTFFLTSSDENNLAILSGFTENTRVDKLCADDSIYVFANGNYGTLIEDTVRGKINSNLNGEAENDYMNFDGPKKMITLFSVNRYRSIVYNLLEDKPMFTALSDESKELRIAIFGSGKIGTEMFLAAYWCGQMLGHELKITVVSVEKEDRFRKRIDHINSEILRTSKQVADKELLRISKNSEKQAECYFSLEYIESNVYLDGLDTILTAERLEPQNGRLADFDYFVVALGSDNKNLEVAEHIGRIVTVRSNAEHREGALVPIACAIWNDELSKSIKDIGNTGLSKVEIIPFGSMEDSFNIEKIMLDKIKERAERTASLYEKKVAEYKSKGKKNDEDPYSYWANVSRAIHSQYKADFLKLSTKDDSDHTALFLEMCDYLSHITGIRELLLNRSSYEIPESDSVTVSDLMSERRVEFFKYLSEAKKELASLQAIENGTYSNEIKNYIDETSNVIAAAAEFAAGAEFANIQGALNKPAPKHPQIFNEIAWLEHRRWVAFIRTEGFRCPTIDEEKKYIAMLQDDNDNKGINKGKHKSIALKLHPCIVECDHNGMKEDLFNTSAEYDDMLDGVSRRIKTEYPAKGLRSYDFKMYDYPEFE